MGVGLRDVWSLRMRKLGLRCNNYLICGHIIEHDSVIQVTDRDELNEKGGR